MKTLQDYPEEQLDALDPAREKFASHATDYGFRSVRLSASPQFDVPTIRVEATGSWFQPNAMAAFDEYDLEILVPFAAADGNLGALVGRRDG